MADPNSRKIFDFDLGEGQGVQTFEIDCRGCRAYLDGNPCDSTTRGRILGAYRMETMGLPAGVSGQKCCGETPYLHVTVGGLDT